MSDIITTQEDNTMSVAQMFIEADKQLQRANRALERTVRSAEDPTKVAQTIVSKIRELLGETSVIGNEILQRAVDVIEPARADESRTRARAKRQSTTIDIDPETSKPVIIPGFNPRKKFG